MKKYTLKEFSLIMLRHFGAGLAILVIFYFLSKFFGSLCPTYRIFGICCPFCGMTRAHLSALRLDLEAAMYYNPTFFLGIPALFFMVHDRIAPKYEKLRKIIAGILLGIIVAVYIVRVFYFKSFDFFA